MPSDLEIDCAAQATIQTYGDGAGLQAAQRADELMAEGDMEGRRVWHRIGAASECIDIPPPHPGVRHGVDLGPSQSLPEIRPNARRMSVFSVLARIRLYCPRSSPSAAPT